MSNDRNKTILEEIKNNSDKSNADIARILAKKYPKDFNGWKEDSIRRKVSKVRNKHGLANDASLDKIESYSENGDTAILEKVVNERVKSLDDLIRVCKIDTKIWFIEKYECSVYEGQTRLRRFDETIGKRERIDDEHKLVQQFRVKAYLKRNKELILMNSIKDEVIAEMKKYSPNYKKIEYKIDKSKRGYLLEVNIFDLHFGRMTWEDETGSNYDIKIARDLFLTCINKLIEHSKNYNITKILFIVGNDFFNVDNPANTTYAGTPQDEDTRWKKTFKKGRELLIEAIDLLSQTAPVDVVVIPGNHDSTRTFHCGDSLECQYHSSKNVNIDNSPKVRKYYQFGKCMIGYAHGRDEKFADYPLIMASEEPKMWAETRYKEWHLGEIHHKREIKWLSTEEYKGVTVRYMRTLASPDAWSFSKGYVSSLRAGEGFVWDSENGLVAQFTANL